MHADQIRHSLVNGFYQGWDLHPAQLPTRFAAVYAFFLEGLNYFLRAINCGAITEQEAIDKSSLTIAELRSRSFAAILNGRRAS